MAGPSLELSEMRPLHRETWKHFLGEARRLREARRAFSLTGAAALDSLIKQDVEGYYLCGRHTQYVPLRADKLAEPSNPYRTV